MTRAMQTERAVLGGEENGGIIFPQFQLARDGGMAIAAVLDLLAARDEPRDVLLQAIPRYTLVKEKLACPTDRREEAMEKAVGRLAAGATRVERIDGVKIHRADGWLLFGPSGSEPLIRIFADAREPARARALAAEGMEALRAALDGAG